jgi:hypothetical protein
MLLNSLPTSVHAEWNVSNEYQIVPPDVSYLKSHLLQALWTAIVLSLVVVMVIVGYWDEHATLQRVLSSIKCRNEFIHLGVRKVKLEKK